jgi:hypothetical protein
LCARQVDDAHRHLQSVSSKLAEDHVTNAFKAAVELETGASVQKRPVVTSVLKVHAGAQVRLRKPSPPGKAQTAS